MSIEITKDTIGIWYVELNKSNWMAELKRLPDGKIKLTYRFRYYEDDQAFDSADRKNWYTAMTDVGEAKSLSAIRSLGNVMASAEGTELHELMMTDAGPDDLLNRLLVQPWARVQQEGHA